MCRVSASELFMIVLKIQGKHVCRGKRKIIEIKLSLKIYSGHKIEKRQHTQQTADRQFNDKKKTIFLTISQHSYLLCNIESNI
jgi:translation elongation factor P/translation initiation factor 5A